MSCAPVKTWPSLATRFHAGLAPSVRCTRTVAADASRPTSLVRSSGLFTGAWSIRVFGVVAAGCVVATFVAGFVSGGVGGEIDDSIFVVGGVGAVSAGLVIAGVVAEVA